MVGPVQAIGGRRTIYLEYGANQGGVGTRVNQHFAFGGPAAVPHDISVTVPHNERIDCAPELLVEAYGGFGVPRPINAVGGFESIDVPDQIVEASIRRWRRVHPHPVGAGTVLDHARTSSAGVDGLGMNVPFQPVAAGGITQLLLEAHEPGWTAPDNGRHNEPHFVQALVRVEDHMGRLPCVAGGQIVAGEDGVVRVLVPVDSVVRLGEAHDRIVCTGGGTVSDVPHHVPVRHADHRRIVEFNPAPVLPGGQGRQNRLFPSLPFRKMHGH